MSLTTTTRNGCVICLDDIAIGKQMAHPCGHIYHTECLEEWYTKSFTCPQCRSHATAYLVPDDDLSTLSPKMRSIALNIRHLAIGIEENRKLLLNQSQKMHLVANVHTHVLNDLLDFYTRDLKIPETLFWELQLNKKCSSYQEQYKKEFNEIIKVAKTIHYLSVELYPNMEEQRLTPPDLNNQYHLITLKNMEEIKEHLNVMMLFESRYPRNAVIDQPEGQDLEPMQPNSNVVTANGRDEVQRRPGLLSRVFSSIFHRNR